jgi:hypothetical protein
MQRLFAFFAALVLTTVSVSTACTAAPATILAFTLEQSEKSKELQARFRKADGQNIDWSSSFASSELAGLDLARFHAPGTAPLSFALLREAGRLDCAGTGGNSLVRGTCRLTPDAGFLDLLDRRGIGRPTDDEAFGLVALNVRRHLIESLAAERYPTPKIDDLMSLTALGVTKRYIAELSRVGYRPATLDGLVQFKALNITPEFIHGFVRLGYADLPADELVHLKALNVTADYVAGFRQLGYRDLPVGKLVQMKALGVTPDYVRSLQAEGMALPSPDRLVKLRALGYWPRRR